MLLLLLFSVYFFIINWVAYTNILILTEQPNDQIKYLEIHNLNTWLLRDYNKDRFI